MCESALMLLETHEEVKMQHFTFKQRLKLHWHC